MCRVSVRNARFRVPVSIVSNKVPAVIALAEYITPRQSRSVYMYKEDASQHRYLSNSSKSKDAK